jgi:tRNA modification GTPase
MYVRDIIAAISTPLGAGGIGIVRISGDQAGRIGAAVFNARHDGGFTSHRFSYGSVVGLDGDVLDEGMAVFMRAPNSYTREDVFEIHCHGGMLVTQRVLELTLACGARLAEPGEFTKRAFLNGRIDLLQAEAVMDVIQSKTDAALRLAEHQREGLLSVRLTGLRDSLRIALSLVEAHIDFPEDEIDSTALLEIDKEVHDAIAAFGDMVASFREGRVLRDGVAVAIVGKPNVGKSSLLNTLLREKRAIVTATPGTTRDVIEEILNIEGLPVRLLDTAGIRETSDEVEQLGIQLTMDRVARADLVLFLLDRSAPFDDGDLLILNSLKGVNFVVVRNKSDLPADMFFIDELGLYPSVDISTKSGVGIDALRQLIYEMFISGMATDSREFIALSQARHRDALLKGMLSLERASSCIGSGADLELIAVDLRDALHAIGEVTGETTPDDVLDLIFSRFCIGK